MLPTVLLLVESYYDVDPEILLDLTYIFANLEKKYFCFKMNQFIWKYLKLANLLIHADKSDHIEEVF